MSEELNKSDSFKTLLAILQDRCNRIEELVKQRDEWRAAACKMEDYIHTLVDCNTRHLTPVQPFYELQDKYPL